MTPVRIVTSSGPVMVRVAVTAETSPFALANAPSRGNRSRADVGTHSSSWRRSLAVDGDATLL